MNMNEVMEHSDSWVKYNQKLSKAEQKIRILEDMIEETTRELYLKNIELKKQNDELEQFAYVSSHDLQEPLRTLISFAELLQSECKGKLDENADKYIEFMLVSANRMRTLIKSLLDYSRIGHEKQLKIINCNDILKEIITDIGSLIKESNAQISYNNLPSINAYETELHQLFQNLLINAIKFRKHDVIPQIVISAENKNQEWQFSVKDNGIGIDPKFHDKIFLIFQRLHTQAEYKGTGIGLAFCKKIAEMHGGRIWVESEPGQGSTFYFTIKT